jgi:hypothetical protein
VNVVTGEEVGHITAPRYGVGTYTYDGEEEPAMCQDKDHEWELIIDDPDYRIDACLNCAAERLINKHTNDVSVF